MDLRNLKINCDNIKTMDNSNRFDNPPTTEKVVELRTVHNYKNCWQEVRPTSSYVGKIPLSEIGVPIDMYMSNEPLKPAYLVNYYSRFETSLNIGIEEFDKLYGSQSVELTNYLAKLLQKLEIMDRTDDPAFEWANAMIQSLDRDAVIKKEDYYLFGNPKEIKNAINMHRDRLAVIIQKVKEDPNELIPFAYSVNKDTKGAHGLEDLTKSRLIKFGELVGVDVRYINGDFQMINTIYTRIKSDFDSGKLGDNSPEIENIINNSILINADSPLIPNGIISRDGYHWDGFSIDKDVKPMIYDSAGRPMQQTRDNHVDARIAMWRGIRDVNGLHAEDNSSNNEIPIPPNLESGYVTIVPYNVNGEAKYLALLSFNDITRINPIVIENAKTNFGECFFVAPDKNGINKVWLPKFSDKNDVDFQMAIVDSQEPLYTQRFEEIDFGMKGIYV